MSRSYGTLVGCHLALGTAGWVGATLIIDYIFRRQRRLNLSERLRLYQPPTVADEAEVWLRQR